MMETPSGFIEKSCGLQFILEVFSWRKVMLRVDARQGAPKDGSCPIELLQVEIYPLKIHLTEAMYRVMWGYFFPEEEQDSQRRQEVWKVSTTAGARRVKKGALMNEAPPLNTHSTKGVDISKSTASGSSQAIVNADASQASKGQNPKANIVSISELRRTSSFDRTWEENVAESVANELVSQVQSSRIPVLKGELPCNNEQQDENARNKSKDSKQNKSGRSSNEEKKVGKVQDEKRSRPRRLRQFNNVKISQVELLLTYSGSRFAVSDLRLLMDTFQRVDFTGTWGRLFSRVKKHIIWGVLKSVTGMQGKKFKDKTQTLREASGASEPDGIVNFGDNDGGSAGKSDQYSLAWPKRPNDGAGDGFVTSVRGLFNSQRRKAKAFVLRTMRGEADEDLPGDWSEGDVEFSPFARQMTITKAKKLIRRHTKKFESRGQTGLPSEVESPSSSPRETSPVDSDSSSESLPDEVLPLPE